jgi:hypothetical protein
MIAIARIGDDGPSLAAQALIAGLAAPQPIVRRCFSEKLGLLKVASTGTRIAEHLADEQAIPGAWFDDTSTIRRQSAGGCWAANSRCTGRPRLITSCSGFLLPVAKYQLSARDMTAQFPDANAT